MGPEYVKFDWIIEQCDILFRCSITYHVTFLWLKEGLFEHVFYLKNLFFEVKTWLFLFLRFIVEIRVFYQEFFQNIF